MVNGHYSQARPVVSATAICGKPANLRPEKRVGTIQWPHRSKPHCMPQPASAADLLGAARSLLTGRGAYLVVLIIALGVSLTAVYVHGAPVPHIHDEFTYLFAGETYANFRLSNPSPPSPASFWSPHLLVEPSFASKYPPAQGLVLAIGEWFGNPLIGLLLSGVLAAIALLWALRAFVGPLPALVATIAFAGSALYLGVWIRTYMGGFVAFACASLVLGFCLRLHRHSPTKLAYLATGIGMAGLFLSRPFEGAIVCLLAALAYAGQGLRQWRADRRGVARGALIAALPLVLAFSFQAAINHAVTGSVWRMPHSEFHAQYMTQPIFIWQQPQPALKPSLALTAGEDALIEKGDWLQHVRASVSGERAAASAVGGLALPWWVLLSLPFLALLEWRLLIVLAGFPMLHALSNYLQLHFYFGPIAPVWFLSISAMFEIIRRHAALRATSAVLMILLPASLALPGFMETPSTHDYRHHHDLTEALAQRPPSLVFIHYGTSANPHLAVVYNDPLLRNHSLFVNELNPAANCAVLNAFPGRELWRAVIEEDGIQAAITEPSALCPPGSDTVRPETK